MGKTTTMVYRLRWVATAMILLCLGQIAAWAWDREPPFKLIGYSVERPVHVGGPLRITLAVQRDLTRQCDVTVSRWIVDGRKFLIYLPQLAMDAHAIASLEQSSKDENRILLQMPDDAAPGNASYVTTLSYVCNPVHRFLPVRFSYEIPFVLEK
jgi:hypothetical protein